MAADPEQNRAHSTCVAAPKLSAQQVACFDDGTRALRRLAIDQSGLGMQLAEELVRKHRSQVEPITMTAPVKESLASRILAVFQRGDVSIPDHRPLIDDLHSIQRTVTLSGNVRYAAPREAGSHADRWTALALHAAGPAPALGGPVIIM